MNKYKTSKSLKGKKLKKGDMICLAGIIHTVEDDFLNNTEECSNSVVFDLLGLRREKEMFCQKHYGYRPKEGDFPESEEGDFEALTKVAMALLILSEEKGYSSC